jgi:hypothetical protein
MTNQLPNDLSHLSDAEFNAFCPQGEHAPGPAPLSPAAQAVVNAVDHYETNHWLTPREVAAAALRAAADQVVPETTTPWNSTLTLIMSTPKVRAKLLAIADELEAQ